MEWMNYLLTRSLTDWWLINWLIEGKDDWWKGWMNGLFVDWLIEIP